MLDIDHFKNINDALGHHYGDLLLKEFGKRLSDVTRKTDTASRLGGDEFLLLMTEAADTESVAISTQRILNQVRKPFILTDHEIKITVSVGISIYPDDGEDLATLIKYADTAMYKAKQDGRNNYSRYEPSMSTIQ